MAGKLAVVIFYDAHGEDSGCPPDQLGRYHFVCWDAFAVASTAWPQQFPWDREDIPLFGVSPMPSFSFIVYGDIQENYQGSH